MATPISPPNRIFPYIASRATDGTEACPAGMRGFSQVTVMALFERRTWTSPGVLIDHAPLSLESRQLAPAISSPDFSRVVTRMLWTDSPVMDAQPEIAALDSSTDITTRRIARPPAG